MGATGASQPNTVASLRPRAVELIPDADSENKAWAHRIWRDVQSVASGNLAEKTIWNQVRRAGRAPKDKRRARYSYPSRIFYCGPRARVSPSGRPPPDHGGLAGPLPLHRAGAAASGLLDGAGDLRGPHEGRLRPPYTHT
jgi:hypothetical protein